MEWRRAGLQQLPALLTRYSESDQEELLLDGLGALEAAGVPRESLTCFRASDFAADERTWRVMERCGFSLSSNYNLCSRFCRLRPEARTVDAFQATDSVLEVPIGAFIERDVARILTPDRTQPRLDGVRYRDVGFTLSVAFRDA